MDQPTTPFPPFSVCDPLGAPLLPRYAGELDFLPLVYAGSELCSMDSIANATPPAPWWTLGAFVLLVDRGACAFTSKVRNGQLLGAAAVLVGDDHCLCGEEACVPAQGITDCENRLPTMADDGSGGDISIPSFLVGRSGAEAIKAYLVQVSASHTHTYPHAASHCCSSRRSYPRGRRRTAAAS